MSMFQHCSPPGSIIIAAEGDIAIPARILDLFTAQGLTPAAFLFECRGTAIQILVAPGAMPTQRRAVLLARIVRIAGVKTAHCVAPAAE